MQKSENEQLKLELEKKDKIIENFKKYSEEMRTNLMKSKKDINKLVKKIERIEKEFISPKGFIAKMKETLKTVLSSNQIDIITKKKKRVFWTKDEIASAFLLRYFGKRGYMCIKNDFKIPLPSISTLNRYASKIDIRSGILKDILTFMKINSENFLPRDFATVLSFDEMKVESIYEYDPAVDEILGPHKYLQVIMARGLFKNWKQIIYVGFDKKMTKEIYDEIYS